MKFVEYDLTELMDEGVLMAANERFFWPLGLALTWTLDTDTGEASELHIREWDHPPGEGERIETTEDELVEDRRIRFIDWVDKRFGNMKPEEAFEGRKRLGI